MLTVGEYDSLVAGIKNTNNSMLEEEKNKLLRELNSLHRQGTRWSARDQDDLARIKERINYEEACIAFAEKIEKKRSEAVSPDSSAAVITRAEQLVDAVKLLGPSKILDGTRNQVVEKISAALDATPEAEITKKLDFIEYRIEYEKLERRIAELEKGNKGRLYGVNDQLLKNRLDAAKSALAGFDDESKTKEPASLIARLKDTNDVLTPDSTIKDVIKLDESLKKEPDSTLNRALKILACVALAIVVVAAIAAAIYFTGGAPLIAAAFIHFGPLIAHAAGPAIMAGIHAAAPVAAAGIAVVGAMAPAGVAILSAGAAVAMYAGYKLGEGVAAVAKAGYDNVVQPIHEGLNSRREAVADTFDKTFKNTPKPSELGDTVKKPEAPEAPEAVEAVEPAGVGTSKI